MTKALNLLAALLFAFPVFAQNPRMYSQPELDQMLAPVALYPDPLLSQVLMAATYPGEVIEAANWSRANPGLQGDEAVRAVQFEDWDPSVKSLVAFPQILQRMAENPQWMQSLGEAFLAQEPHVMDAVQQLRRRAQAAGNLQSSEQLHVQQQGQTIVLLPASPQLVYVPYYDPLVVYGAWWWPAYRPLYWAPWPRNHGVHISLGFFFGNFDWHRHHVRVVHPNAYYYRHRHAHAVATDRGIAVAPQRWRHEPQRRAAFAERRAVQARPVQIQAPALRQETRAEQRIEQRVERREDRREDRRQVRTVPPQASVPVAPVMRAPAAVPVQVAPAIRMPAASTPPQPRVERQEQRQERREQRQEQRQERQERREQRQEQRGLKG